MAIEIKRYVVSYATPYYPTEQMMIYSGTNKRKALATLKKYIDKENVITCTIQRINRKIIKGKIGKKRG